MPFASAEDNARLFAGVRAACEEAGRDPSSLVYSSALVLCVGKDEAEIARRAAAIGREVDELREHGVAGTPAEAVDVLGRYAEAGAQRFYLQVLDLADLDHLDLVASEVAPQLRLSVRRRDCSSRNGCGVLSQPRKSSTGMGRAIA